MTESKKEGEMKEARKIIAAAQSASGQKDSLSYVRIGFRPENDGSIHELDRRHPKKSKKKVTARCRGKVRYKSREQAKAALITIRYTSGISSIEEAKEKHLPFREYPCYLGCGQWHLTSRVESPAAENFDAKEFNQYVA
jgi:hypothetical protein